jgi:tRNA (adenine57-N1/adenine58-N1)-methyltransferase
MHTITLQAGQRFHTEKGGIDHDTLIGSGEGVVVTSSKGTQYLALRPLLHDFVMSMPRGATIIYPKDAALIVGFADIHPGAHVLEAGAGSGALSCWLLRAVTDGGHVTSVERREDFAEIARRNVSKLFGDHPANWTLLIGALEELAPPGPFDRVVLDMLAPWEMLPVLADCLVPGGVLCVYVATTTQLSRTVESLRAAGGWTEPKASETMHRTWHVEGLAVRPDHRMVGHTGFLLYSRRLAPGVTALAKRTRPAKGAYGPDYEGPRR